uniref:Putative metastriate ixostatin family member n=1 Tax=Rhipicephalus pulchellus TaxID=72859 RepID=L7M9S2_RHIPC
MTSAYVAVALLGCFICIATQHKGHHTHHDVQNGFPAHLSDFPLHPIFHHGCESTDCPPGYKICCLLIRGQCGCKCVPMLHHCSYAWEDECPLPHRPNCAHTDAENLCHCDFAGFYAVLGLPK